MFNLSQMFYSFILPSLLSKTLKSPAKKSTQIFSDTIMLRKGALLTWISSTQVSSWFQAILGPLNHKSMAGRHQKCSILDQKWPIMAGLPMSRCGPKGSQMVPNGQYNMFLTIWGIFGLIWTLLDHFRQNLIFCSKLLWPRSTLCFWGKKSILS